MTTYSCPTVKLGFGVPTTAVGRGILWMAMRINGDGQTWIQADLQASGALVQSFTTSSPNILGENFVLKFPFGSIVDTSDLQMWLTVFSLLTYPTVNVYSIWLEVFPPPPFAAFGVPL
jgi:hypothetical protein